MPYISYLGAEQDAECDASYGQSPVFRRRVMYKIKLDIPNNLRLDHEKINSYFHNIDVDIRGAGQLCCRSVEGYLKDESLFLYLVQKYKQIHGINYV